MKIFKLLFFSCLFLFVMCFAPCLNAQNKPKKMFLRVYNLEGEKMTKGFVIFANDSILALKKADRELKINFEDIGYIKTNRSGGNNVLIGALTGAIPGIIFGVATADPDDWIFGYTKSEGALAFGIMGAIGGGTVGALTILAKKSQTFIINSDPNKWKSFCELLNNYKKEIVL